LCGFVWGGQGKLYIKFDIEFPKDGSLNAAAIAKIQQVSVAVRDTD